VKCVEILASNIFFCVALTARGLPHTSMFSFFGFEKSNALPFSYYNSSLMQILFGQSSI